MATKYPDSKHDDPLALGDAFAEAASGMLRRLYGIVLHPCIGKPKQIMVGENDEGYEFKLDQHIARSRRISIEVGEKTQLQQSSFFRSGIFRNDNTLFYVQGFWDFAWLFHRSDLRQYYSQARPEVISDDPPTIQKFYLPLHSVHELAFHLFAITDKGVAWYNVCSHDSPVVPKWKDCQPCPDSVDGHCNTKQGKELRIYLTRR